MIKVIEAKNELRKRDKKRRRVLLQVGKKRWHLSTTEAYLLYLSLQHCKF